jgi:Holliday junction DNA helicase RuvB
MSNGTEIQTGAPPTLDHVVGQRRAIQQLKVAIEAVINDRAAAPSGSEPPALGHLLFVGPSGTGKSTLSGIVAKELGATCHEELAQNIATPAQLQGLMMLADPGDVIFIDEVHELHPLVQTTLYRALEERRLFLPAGPRGERNSITLPPLTFIGATTDEYRLSAPLRQRFKQVVRLQHYSDDELGQALAQRARRLGWSIEPAAIAELATKGRGTPRLAIRLLEAARRVSRAEGATTISAEHVRRMMDIEGIDSIGLDSLERRYLQILKGSSSAVRLNVLATMLGLPRRTIEVVIESDLLRLGIVTKDDDGRILTPKGREHLARSELETINQQR